VSSGSTQLLGFPAVWLRHNCPCPDCRDPVTGQRLVDMTRIPTGPVATVTAESADSVEVTFAPDGHRSVFSRAWLAAFALPDADAADVADAADAADSADVADVADAADVADVADAADVADVADVADARTEDGKVLWRAASLAAVPAADWAGYLASDAVRASVLDAVARYGAGLLRGVPVSAGMVTSVAETFGYVRETNYGRIFDVRVVADPANLAFTNRAIAPHTDNPYRDPVPTLQLLHCLRDASAGGDTVLVDGFAAAAALRSCDRGSFDVLTSTPIPFAYVDKATSLTASQPLISLSPRGRITAVRLNNRSMQPVRLPYDQAEAVYAAYRAWTAMVARPEFALGLRLAPGDCLIFDNTRVLHARTAFAPAPSSSSGPGERHLQGCYADLDGLLSTLAVLRGSSPTTGG
jgi:gamma-butyrobetaine dioxygenase